MALARLADRVPRALLTTGGAANTAGNAGETWSNTTGNTAAWVTRDVYCPTFAPQRQTAVRRGCTQPLRLADELRSRPSAKPPTSKAPPTNMPHNSQRLQSRGVAGGCSAASPASGCACAATWACAGCHCTPRSRRSACSTASTSPAPTNTPPARAVDALHHARTRHWRSRHVRSARYSCRSHWPPRPRGSARRPRRRRHRPPRATAVPRRRSAGSAVAGVSPAIPSRHLPAQTRLQWRVPTMPARSPR